jgi:signal transduction histidine kinase
VPGLGLGLFISREIVAGHGGKISAESGGDGKGTTFRVTLPGRAADRTDGFS